jgi:hypothetical protein
VPYPFELDEGSLMAQLDEMAGIITASLQSQFLVLPRSASYVEYLRFQAAYEVLKRCTRAFEVVSAASLWAALRADSLCLVVLRTILGLTPPEWAELARTEVGVNLNTGAVRALEVSCRAESGYCARLTPIRNAQTIARLDALVAVAVSYLHQGAATSSSGVVHRLDKVDTVAGLTSLRQAATLGVPYAMLLYERFLGRPFASYRDTVSELVGEVMEAAIEGRLVAAGITYRKTGRAERLAGFDLAPDFLVPDEFAPAVAIEAKLASDDGTARDKTDRIQALAEMRDRRVVAGQPSFELVACIDGRGFGVRRTDLRRTLLNTKGKVFTLATLDHLITATRLRDFVSRSA